MPSPISNMRFPKSANKLIFPPKPVDSRNGVVCHAVRKVARAFGPCSGMAWKAMARRRSADLEVGTSPICSLQSWQINSSFHPNRSIADTG